MIKGVFLDYVAFMMSVMNYTLLFWFHVECPFHPISSPDSLKVLLLSSMPFVSGRCDLHPLNTTWERFRFRFVESVPGHQQSFAILPPSPQTGGRGAVKLRKVQKFAREKEGEFLRILLLRFQNKTEQEHRKGRG